MESRKLSAFVIPLVSIIQIQNFFAKVKLSVCLFYSSWAGSSLETPHDHVLNLCPDSLVTTPWPASRWEHSHCLPWASVKPLNSSDLPLQGLQAPCHLWKKSSTICLISLAFVEKKWVERTRKLHNQQVLFHFACLCGCVSEKKEELTQSSSINLWHTYLVAATK